MCYNGRHRLWCCVAGARALTDCGGSSFAFAVNSAQGVLTDVGILTLPTMYIIPETSLSLRQRPTTGSPAIPGLARERTTERIEHLRARRPKRVSIDVAR